MAMTTKASLLTPNPKFATNGTHDGVWKRNTVTSCWSGQIIKLKTTEAAGGTCCCDIIRVGDEFAIARGFGDPQRKLKEYERASGASLTT